MIRSTLLFALAYVSLVGIALNAGELKVEPDKENVVASRLQGTWRIHKSLTQRLTGGTEFPVGEWPSKSGDIAFTSDPSVAGSIPAKYAGFFREHRMKVYLAGQVEIDGKSHPFVVTQIRGNPHVFFWLERDGDAFGNGESFNVMLAVAADRQKDLLFVGGDFNNQPFSAFERAQTETETEKR